MQPFSRSVHAAASGAVKAKDGRPAARLTRHAERPPQASGVLLALFELHAADPDDLADQEEAWPHQFAAAQILEAEDKGQRQGGEGASGGGGLTVNSAGRLLSFSISLGIPMLSQRTRKFSLKRSRPGQTRPG